MPKLNFPSTYDFKITKSEGDRYFIYDKIRKKNLLLTPEEWVRQHFIHYALEEGVLPSQCVIEKEFDLYGTKKRLDMVLMKKQIPQILVELKAPDIILKPLHFEQVARYNAYFNAPMILLSNGMQHLVWHFNEMKEYEPNEDWAALFRRVFSK